MNKECIICHQLKDESLFYIKKDYRKGNTFGKLYVTRYCKKCMIAVGSGKYQYKLRCLVIDKLGGKCCKCGFNDIRALQVDHINGGGNKDRKTRHWYTRYKEIVNGTDTSFQLLCANCNAIKRMENKECFQ